MMNVLANEHGADGLMPVCCPVYRNDTVTCVSRSGDSLCGYYCGSHELRGGVHIVTCDEHEIAEEGCTDG